MQARDREPLRCVQNCTPSHASSMPELPAPALRASPSTSVPPTGGIGAGASTITLAQESPTSPTNLGASQTDPPTPTSRRVRFQGDLDVNDHGSAPSSSNVPISPANDTNSSSSPSPPPNNPLSRTNVPRSRSLQPEEVASTSTWGGSNSYRSSCINGNFTREKRGVGGS